VTTLAPARLDVQIDKDVLTDVFAALGLSDTPPSITYNATKIAKDKNGEDWGMYDAVKNHIYIFCLPESFQKLPLKKLQPLIRDTLLHEIRHAYQQKHWSPERMERARQGGYRVRGVEKDARKWALDNSPKFKGLVKVRRQQVGAGRKLP
jgi:hypothetical protein